VDVIVVGLGTMGAAAAHELARRGVGVLGLDRFAPPHDRGAHAGGSRIIRAAYMEGSEYVPLVRRAYQLWREVEELAEVRLLQVNGLLMIGTPDSTAVAGALASARAHDVEVELFDADRIRRRYPQFVPAEHEVGLYEPGAGMIRPELAVSAYLRLAAAAGARLRTDVPVTGWQADDDGVTVSLGDEQVHADRLILAPGAWAPELLALRIPLRVERRVQHYWRSAGPPDAYDPGRFPAWIWEFEPGFCAYGLPAVDHEIKAAMHDGNETVDPDQPPEPVRPAEIELMRAWLAARMPDLAAGGWLGAKPCLYTLTPDEHFVLGQHPSSARVAVACGFSGHGFKFAPVVGEVLADLTMRGHTEHPIRLFDPARFGVVPTGGQPR
jgi:sarcosine oxidase